ncbi:MAG: hypothetical protein JWM68_3521, partial [Verrucomicrobiales bacterium]|nr:hypothetical protein [Verrucomicrobiales bacterium]
LFLNSITVISVPLSHSGRSLALPHEFLHVRPPDATDMNDALFTQLTNLGASLFLSWCVWSYYKSRTFPVTERYSTFGPRFWSGGVDACVLWPLTFIGSLSLVLSMKLPKPLVAVLLIIESLGWLLYTVVMHARYGQTVGKMVTKVRVVDAQTEGNISWRQAWLREGIPMLVTLASLAYEIYSLFTEPTALEAIANGEEPIGGKSFWFITALPGLWFLAEVLTMLTNPKRRALHDLIARTVVVRTNITETEVEIVPALQAGQE